MNNEIMMDDKTMNYQIYHNNDFWELSLLFTHYENDENLNN
jgi:hypothetical protein